MTASIWTKELDLQFIRILRENTGGIWEASKGRNIDWQRLFERGTWPPTFTSSTLNLRWADAYRRWHLPGGVPRDKGNRALQVNFDHLEALIEGHHQNNSSAQHGKRKEGSSSSSSSRAWQIVSPSSSRTSTGVSEMNEGGSARHRASKSQRIVPPEPTPETSFSMVENDDEVSASAGTLASGAASFAAETSPPLPPPPPFPLPLLPPPPLPLPFLPAPPPPPPAAIESLAKTTEVSGQMQLGPLEERNVTDWLAVASTARQHGTWLVRLASTTDMELDTFLAFFTSTGPCLPLFLHDFASLARLLTHAETLLVLPSDSPITSSSSSSGCSIHVIHVGIHRQVISVCGDRSPVAQHSIVRVWDVIQLSPGEQPRRDVLLPLPSELQHQALTLHASLTRSTLHAGPGELDCMLLFVIARASAWQSARVDEPITWPGLQAASRWLLAQLLQHRHVSLHMLSASHVVHFTHPNPLDALLALGSIQPPPWLEFFGRTAATTPQGRAAFVDALRDAMPAPIQLAIVQVGEQAARSSAVHWHDRKTCLSLLAERDGLFAALLRVWFNENNNNVIVECALQDKVCRLRVDGVIVKLEGDQQHRRACFVASASRLEVRFCKNDGRTHRIDVHLSNNEYQQQHLLVPTLACVAPATPPVSDTPLELPLKQDCALDEALGRLGLQRKAVARGKHCLVRAILSARHLDVTADSIARLRDRIWERALQNRFHCSALSHEQQRALLIESAAAGGTPLSSEVFWRAAFVWAAPVIQLDILVLTNEARECTIYPGVVIGHSPPTIYSIAISDVPQHVLSRRGPFIVLVCKDNNDHIEWAQLKVQPSVDPNALLVVASGRPQPPPPAARSLLNEVLVGDVVNVPIYQSTSTHENDDRWWRSYDSFASAFRSAVGRVVWFKRSESNASMWQQQPLGQLPAVCAPLGVESTVEDYLVWHQSASQVAPDDLHHLFALVDVPIAGLLTVQLYEACPMFGYLSDRFSPYSLCTYLRRRFATTIDRVPRVMLTPSIVPEGSICLRLQRENELRKNYHWFIGFNDSSIDSLEMLNVVDAAPTLRPLKVGQMVLLQGSNTHSYETLVTPTRSAQLSPSVAIVGDVAWLGRTAQEAEASIERMLAAEERGAKGKGITAISMLACLYSYNEQVAAAADDVHRAHLTAMLPILGNLIVKEAKQFESLPLALRQSNPCVIDRDDLWSCSKCDAITLNTTVWRRNDEIFCLDCFSENRNAKDQLAENESYDLSFHFARPTELLALFRRLSQSFASVVVQQSEERN